MFEVSLADLQNDEVAFRKFRLISEDVQGKQVFTNFHGMTMTTDKLRSLVKKWQVRGVVILSCPPPSLSLSSICYRGKVQMVSMIFNGMYLSSHLALLLPPPTATPLIDKAIVVTPSSLVKVPVSMSTHPSLVCTMFHVCMCAARTGTRRL